MGPVLPHHSPEMGSLEEGIFSARQVQDPWAAGVGKARRLGPSLQAEPCREAGQKVTALVFIAVSVFSRPGALHTDRQACSADRAFEGMKNRPEGCTAAKVKYFNSVKRYREGEQLKARPAEGEQKGGGDHL